MSDKRKRLKCILFNATLCLIATALATFYTVEIWTSLNITLVNILCIPIAITAFVYGLTDEVNVHKAFSFTTAAIVAAIEMLLNLNSDKAQIGALHIRSLSLWSVVWGILLFVFTVLLLIILRRLFLWSQDQWTEYRKAVQKRRIESKELYAKLRNQRRAALEERNKENRKHKADNKKEIDTSRDTHNKQIRDLKNDIRLTRYEYRRQIQEIKLGSRTDSENARREAKSAEKPPDRKAIKTTIIQIILFVLIAAVLIILFWRVPYCVSSKVDTANPVWLDYVVEFISLLETNDDKQEAVITDGPANSETMPEQDTGKNEITAGPAQSLIAYFLIYIVAIATILVMGFVLWSLIGRFLRKSKTTVSFDFARDYDFPISILLVFIAILFVLGNGSNSVFASFNRASELWQMLLYIIFLIIIVFVTIEIILLILRQCSMPHTLFKNIIHLTFTAIMEFISSFLLGVIVNFRMQNIISGMLTLIFMPENDLEFVNQTEEKARRMFLREVNSIGSKSKELTRRVRIWRR